MVLDKRLLFVYWCSFNKRITFKTYMYLRRNHCVANDSDNVFVL